jgi:hypothetical protein
VAREISPSTQTTSVSKHTGQPATATKILAAADAALPGEETAESLNVHRTAQNTRFVRDAVVATRHDDFDPEIFNRRYHESSTQNDRQPGNE